MQTRLMPTLGLGLISAPTGAQGQRIAGNIVVNERHYHSEVVTQRPRFRYRGRMLEVVRWFPRRGFIATERYRRFHIPVHPLQLPVGMGRETLRRRGFRPITLYLKDSVYFRRVWTQGYRRTLRPVVVWQRAGEFFRPAPHDSRPGH